MHPILKTFLTWIITCAAGTLLLYIGFSAFSGESLGYGTEVTVIAGYVFVISLACSLPGMIFYHFVDRILNRTVPDNGLRKFLKSLSAVLIIVLTILAILFLSHEGFNLHDDKELPLIALAIIIPYGLPFIVCNLIFDRSGRQLSDLSLEELDTVENETGTRRLPDVHFWIITIAVCITILMDVIDFINYHPLRYNILFPLILLIFLPVGLYLLWRKKRAGWIILCAYSAMSFIFIPWGIFNMYKYKVELGITNFKWLLTSLLPIMIFILLNTKVVVNYFYIQSKDKAIAIASGIGAAIIYIVVYYYFSAHL